MRSLITLEKISFLFRAAMLLFMTLFISFSAQALDGGTETNPYQISSASDLSSGLGAGYYLVNEDVTCSTRITVTGEVTLTLAEGKTLTAEAGIEVGSGATLNIYGPGSLVATGNDNNAGIGGNKWNSFGTVKIFGGTVASTGGSNAAGIGSGFGGTSGLVEISSGTVDATGGVGAAGIGGGANVSGDKVIISGGEITAKGGDEISAGYGANGIGIGSGGSGGTIEISGGTVNATGGAKGAGIGGGQNGNVKITNGNITALGGSNGAGIGSGQGGYAGIVNISGGKVTAIGSENAAGIGGGYNSSGAAVTISNGTVIATGGTGAVGIGAGKSNGTHGDLNVSNINVYGGNSTSSMALITNWTTRYQYMVVAESLDLVKVTLSDCIIYTDEYWSTICLPFSVNIAGSVLEGATAMKLLPNAVFTPSNGVLTLNFESVSALIAGVPYIIKWPNGSGSLENPQFTGVISTSSSPSAVTTPDVVSFKGTFEQIEYASENTSILFLGGNNYLYYPDGTSKTTIGKYHAYFELLGGITAGTPNSTGQAIKSYVMNFEDSTTGICDIVTETRPQTKWYTLDGRLLREAPVTPGLYIHNGRKVLIK